MSGLVYVFAHVKAKSGHEVELRAALLKLVAVTEAEPGFILYDLHEDLTNPCHFAFYEIWRNQASLDLHGATPAMLAHQSLTKDWVAEISVQTFQKVNG